MGLFPRLAAAIAVVMLSACDPSSPAGGITSMLDSERKAAQRIYANKKEAALQETERYAVGIWTTSEPGMHWYRLNLMPDRKAQYHFALPRSDDWGNPKDAVWEPYTEKEETTGVRIYGVKIYDAQDPDRRLPTFQCSINPNGEGMVCVRLGNDQIPWYKRGDAFPFSE